MPGGTDPTGNPVAGSLMNAPPRGAPPMDAFAPPTAIAIRSSGSPVAGAGPGARAGQPSAAQSATLAPARFAQRSIELGDREVDIGIGVRARHEARLERRGRQEDSARQRGLVPARKERRVALLRILVIADRTGREVRPPHRAGVFGRDRDRKSVV